VLSCHSVLEEAELRVSLEQGHGMTEQSPTLSPLKGGKRGKPGKKKKSMIFFAFAPPRSWLVAIFYFVTFLKKTEPQVTSHKSQVTPLVRSS